MKRSTVTILVSGTVVAAFGALYYMVKTRRNALSQAAAAEASKELSELKRQKLLLQIGVGVATCLSAYAVSRLLYRNIKEKLSSF